MQGLHLVLTFVLGLQQAVVVPPVAPALSQALDALDAVDPWNEAVPQDDQDPTDSLWQAARQALNRADYQRAAALSPDHPEFKARSLDLAHKIAEAASSR